MRLRDVELHEMKASPYPHIVIDDAFDDYAALVDAFPSEADFGPEIRMHGDLTFPDPGYISLTNSSEYYKNLHDYVYSEKFIRTFLEMFDESIEEALLAGELRFDPRTLPIRPEPLEMRGELLSYDNLIEGEAFLFPRLDIGIGKLDYGKNNGGGGIHVDNLTRLVSILLYVDNNPTMVGGEHRMYGLDGFSPVLEHVYAPEGNRLVASLQKNSALHDVNPITQIVGVRKAMYMAVSCSRDLWVPHSDRRMQKLTKSRYQPSAAEKTWGQFKTFVKSKVTT